MLHLNRTELTLGTSLLLRIGIIPQVRWANAVSEVPYIQLWNLEGWLIIVGQQILRWTHPPDYRVHPEPKYFHTHNIHILMMSQQTRSSGPDLRFSVLSYHHLTGSVLAVDLPLPGSIRSTGTREYRWLKLWNWQLTDRYGEKSQQQDATANRFASWMNEMNEWYVNCSG